MVPPEAEPLFAVGFRAVDGPVFVLARKFFAHHILWAQSSAVDFGKTFISSVAGDENRCSSHEGTSTGC